MNGLKIDNRRVFTKKLLLCDVSFPNCLRKQYTINVFLTDYGKRFVLVVVVL